MDSSEIDSALTFWNVPLLPRPTDPDELADGPRQRIWQITPGNKKRATVALITALNENRTRFGGDLETEPGQTGAVQLVKRNANEQRVEALENLRRLACLPPGRPKKLKPVKNLNAHKKNWKWKFKWNRSGLGIEGMMIDKPGKIRWENKDSKNFSRKLHFKYKQDNERAIRELRKLSHKGLPSTIEIAASGQAGKLEIKKLQIYPLYTKNASLSVTETRFLVIHTLALLEAMGYFEPKHTNAYSQHGMPPTLTHTLSILNNAQVVVHRRTNNLSFKASTLFEDEDRVFPFKIDWRRVYILDPETHAARLYFRSHKKTVSLNKKRLRLKLYRSRNPIETRWDITKFRLCPTAGVKLQTENGSRVSRIDLQRVVPRPGYFARLHHTKFLKANRRISKLASENRESKKKPQIAKGLIQDMSQKEKRKVRMAIDFIKTAKLYYQEFEGGSLDQLTWKKLRKQLSHVSGGHFEDRDDLPKPAGGHYVLGIGKLGGVRYER